MNLSSIILFFGLLEGLLCQLSSLVQKDSNTTEADKKDTNQEYVVWNPLCRIPRIDPYDDSIKEYVFSQTPYKCSYMDPLTSLTFNYVTQRHTLRVNSNVFKKYWSTKLLLRCCYSIITRSYFEGDQDETDDNRYDMSKAVCFKNKIDLPTDAENIYVYCTSGNKKIYKTIYFVVVDKKPKSEPSTGKLNVKPYSVLLFGIDSVSRQNFIRALPMTREYIEKRGWLPLEGYTKVADNTFPNLVPILSGKTVDQLTKLCYPYATHKLDDCPFIWKNFSKEGYLTSYTEDIFWMGTFNYERYGFMNSPTDYYSRPVLSAADVLLGDKKKTDATGDYCLGHHPQVEYLFRFNTEFVQRFHDRPYFNLFWTNSFSHDDVNFPSMMDDRIKSFLEDIEPYLNSTVVVFFSDHGMRFGDIRRTFQGWLEDRMPFIYFHLPPSLKAAHPNWYRNLRANKNKLTSPFDLHATLQELLYGRVLQTPPGCPKCVSLLGQVPHRRSCDDAAISSAWCTCSVTDNSKSVTDLHITAPVHHVIGLMNEKFENIDGNIKNGYRCATLSLSNITDVRSQRVGKSLKNTIAFQTNPNKAVFELTVPEGIVHVNLEEVSRISKYGSQSSCIIGLPLLKKFCYCEEI